MRRETKVWGERWLIRQDSTHAISYLKLKQGYRCSWHRHQTKFNLFMVLHGKVGIVTEEINGEQQETILTEGDTFTTRPEQWHEFRVYENSEMLEEMYVEYREEDIIREQVGSAL